MSELVDTFLDDQHKDALSQKKKEELENSEAASRVQNEAVLATLTEIGGKITDFLNAQ